MAEIHQVLWSLAVHAAVHRDSSAIIPIFPSYRGVKAELIYAEQ